MTTTSLAATGAGVRVGVIGLLIPNFSNPVYSAIIEGAEQAATEAGLELVIGSEGGDSFGIGRDRPRTRLDGLLIAGAIDAARIAALDEHGIHWLLLNRSVPGLNRSIVVDDHAAGQMAAAHLLELGHRVIGHITGPLDADTAIRRRDGFLAGMAAAGISVPLSLIAEGAYTAPSGAVAMQSLLRADDRPTAVFAANAASALGAAYAVRRGGAVVPDDVSIVAVHDLPLGDYFEPALSTVRMPLFELGRRGLEVIATLDREQPISEVITSPMTVIARGSSCRLGYRRRF